MLAALLAVLGSRTAAACSCGPEPELTAEKCRASGRAFSGTVAGYRIPWLFENSEIEVHLAVDRVWAGDVPPTLTTTTGRGGGDCGIAPAPGTRIVVCDDEAPTEPPRFAMCSHPAFGDAAERVIADMPPGIPPSVASQPVFPRPAPGPAEARSELTDRLHGALLLFVPFGSTAVGVVAGALWSWRWPLPVEPRRLRRTALVVLFAALLVMAVREALTDRWLLFEWRSSFAWRNYRVQLELLRVLGPRLGSASLVGLRLGWISQRHASRYGGPIRGFLVAVAAVVVLVLAGNAPLHFPFQPSDVRECSEARAVAYLATLHGEPVDRERAAANTPRGCADWGLRRMLLWGDGDESSWKLSYPDGEGGIWWVGGTIPWDRYSLEPDL